MELTYPKTSMENSSKETFLQLPPRYCLHQLCAFFLKSKEISFETQAMHANTKTNTYELCSAKQCRVILPSPPRDKLSHYNTRKRNLFFLFLSFPKWWVFGNVGSPNSSLSIALNYVNLIISCKRTKTLFIIY